MSELLGPAWGPKKPLPGGDSEPPPKPKRYWWRFTLASVLIVAVSAAATATGVLLYVDSIAHALGHNNHLHNKLHSALAQIDSGEPQTILILGSDKRAGVEFEEDPGRSDTTILLRIDPDQGRIAVMSIPRDLKVEIPGFGTEKFNAAYSYGGPKLTLQVIKELTGLRISHVVNVDFLGFVRAVDAIGCVYTDVDRRYYHSNLGLPPSEQYAEINIQPGYQLLCGKKALEYVRYRHTDTDIVRSARQQSFISDARHQVSLNDLLFDQQHLIDIFTEYTQSDISHSTELLEVLKLAAAARNASIDQIHFPAELSPSFVYSTEPQIHHAVEEFLGEAGSDGEFPEKSFAAGGKKKGAKRKHGTKKKKPMVKVEPPGSDGLVSAREAGEAEAKVLVRHVGGGFPVFYPTRLPSGAAYVETNPYEHIVDPRFYHFKDTDGNRHAAYRMVSTYQPEYELNYFGIQGVQGWADLPILDNPSETRTIHGREYDIYVDGENVKLVAWHRGDNTYWVSNSLQQGLTNEQMIGIARSAKVILPEKKRNKQGGKDG
ncbi:MAG TPA: LCP family protein [Solirubrobacterales bacterium]|jgi:LCP family protein required for cell wall assembly|nr:LCP family protein [Solirubrobacterales bacterium]